MVLKNHFKLKKNKIIFSKLLNYCVQLWYICLSYLKSRFTLLKKLASNTNVETNVFILKINVLIMFSSIIILLFKQHKMNSDFLSRRWCVWVVFHKPFSTRPCHCQPAESHPRGHNPRLIPRFTLHETKTMERTTSPSLISPLHK